jgi:Predicted pPIWI-associating nuclease
MANINDLILANKELTGVSGALSKVLGAHLADVLVKQPAFANEAIAAALKESAFTAGAMAAAASTAKESAFSARPIAAAFADVRPTFGSIAQERVLADSLRGISRLIREEVEVYGSLRKNIFSSLDLIKPLNFASLALADSVMLRTCAFDSMKEIASVSQLSAVGKLLGDVNVLSGRLYGLTALSESILSSIRFDTFGMKLVLDEGVRAALNTGLGSFTDHYRWFLTEAVRPDAVVLPDAFVHLPAVEHLHQAELSAATSETEAAEGLDEARGEVAAVVRAETEDDLARLISEFDPKLLKPIRGAREALQNRGPDYERHTATSLREAFTYVLHNMAPDDRIRAWSTSRADFDEKDKPTRSGRLRYICRDVNATFGGFLTANVELVGQFIGEFHRATHGVDIRITHEQLITMQVRMEGLIRLMLLAGLGRLR